jgi:hypothetical protein
MRGLITTLHKQRAALVPVSAPIVYAKREDFGDAAFGELSADHPSHRLYHQLLDEAMEQGYARLMGR